MSQQDRRLLRYARALRDAQYLENESHERLAAMHRFVCHSDGSVCADGCDVAAIPGALAALNAAYDEALR
jgi:hypothetical protein